MSYEPVEDSSQVGDSFTHRWSKDYRLWYMSILMVRKKGSMKFQGSLTPH